MIDTQEPVVHVKDVQRNTVTGWVGWVLFGGITMLIGGVTNMIEGSVALLRDEYYLVRPSGLVVDVDYTTWGWTLLGSGLLLLLVGCGVMFGQTWARVTGVAVAVVNTWLNVVFMPAYPIWAVIAIALNVLVIYALAVHGRELR